MKTHKFLKRLKQIREDAGKSLADISRMSNVQPNTISQMESHGLRISTENLRKCYYPLCRSREEKLQLLILWAVWKDGEDYWQDNADKLQTKNYDHLLATHTKTLAKEQIETLETIKPLDSAEVKLIKQTARIIQTHPHFKAMIEMYLKAEGLI